MVKKKVQLASLGSQHIADHLAYYFPWLLARDFKLIKESEIESKELFDELFPDEDFETNKFKLRSIYTYQQCNTKTKAASTTQSTETLPNVSEE